MKSMLIHRLCVVSFAAILIAPAIALGQAAPAAIAADPPANKAHPATMESFTIPSHGETMNAIAYIASGAGPHPTVLLLHGFPGNEKNLDLAQAIRRAGWNAVYFNYRGSWGSPGVFSFAHAIEDSAAAIAWLRDPVNAARLHSDPKRIALIGHSMGGFMAAYAGSHDSAIVGTALISAANFYQWAGGDVSPENAKTNRARLVKDLVENDILPLAGCTGESLADEMLSHRDEWNFVSYAGLFGDRPLLVVTSNDGLAPEAARLAAAVEKSGGVHLRQQHFETDHSYSDHRIALEITVLDWLAGLP